MNSTSGLQRSDTELAAVATQTRRLWHLIDRRVVWLCVLLISVDLFFLAVHAVHTIYASIYNERIPILAWRWHIDYDRSYSEIFGYMKMIFIALILITIASRKARLMYSALVVIFIAAFLDDSLELHERLGASLAPMLMSPRFADLRPTDLGELLFLAGAGALLSGLTVIGLAKAAGRDRANGFLLLGALAVLMVFVVGLDVIHVMVQYAFRGANLLFSSIEEGGQQITLSLICGLIVLIRREVRSREGARVIQ